MSKKNEKFADYAFSNLNYETFTDSFISDTANHDSLPFINLLNNILK